MLFFKKIIYFGIRLFAWIFCVKKRVHKEVTSPGPALLGRSLPHGFSYTEISDRSRVLAFSIGTQGEKIPPIAIKRRGIIGRVFFRVINKLGVKIQQNLYFEIAPMNEFVKNNILNNEPLLANLKDLFYSRNKSWFKVKWLFSAKGKLWAETDFRIFSFQSHISEDAEKIAKIMSSVLKELTSTPKSQWETWSPIRLLKINGFVNGICLCALFELVWVFILKRSFQNAELLTLYDFMMGSLMVTSCLVIVLLAGIWAAAQDFSTGVFALKYNTTKIMLAVFASTCFILHDLNCDPDMNDAILYKGRILSKEISRSHKRRTSYRAKVSVPDLGETLHYSSRSRKTYDKIEKGDNVHVVIQDGTLGYPWWNEKIYLRN